MDEGKTDPRELTESDLERIRQAHFSRLGTLHWAQTKASLAHNLRVLRTMIVNSGFRLAICSNHMYWRARDLDLNHWSSVTGQKFEGSLTDLICNRIVSSDVWTLSGPEEDIEFILFPMIVG